MPKPDWTLRIDVVIHQPSDEKLDRILSLLQTLIDKENAMSQELDALTAQVQATTDLEKSAVTLIEGIASQLAAIKDDPAKITALSASLKSSADALAAAITANTPAAPAPTP